MSRAITGGLNALAIVRVNAGAASGSQITALGDDTPPPVNTSNGSTVHPDGRVLTFDASGKLLIGTDGGIFARTSPLDSTGAFVGLNNNLSTMELYSLAFDANSKRLVVAAQDNGTSFQATPGGRTFNAIGGGDGINATVNDKTLGTSSAIYTTAQFLGGATRTIVDNQGNIIGQACINLVAPGGFTPLLAFGSPLVLNNIDPTRIAVGDSRVLVTQDSLTGANDPTASMITLNLTSVGDTDQHSSVTALDYGTRNNANAIVAGSGGIGQVFISTSSAAGSLVNLPSYGGLAPTSVKFDTRSDQRFFVADSQNLFGTVNQGTTFQTLTANLPANFIRPTSLGFIDNNGVAALLVGGLNNADNAGNPLVVADSDAAGVLSGWRRFGSGLPNTTVDALQYNAQSDTLAVGTVGRGAFLLYDVTSNFASATVLQFGLANNDSTPDPSILFGNRPLVKFGTGTLSITGAATYTGLTTVTAGTLSVTSAGSIAGDVLNNATFLNAGTIFGQLTNSSGLTVNNGALNGGAIVNGGVLTGTGSIANTMVNGGVFAPGNGTAGSSIAVTGNLAFQSAAQYLVLVNPSTSSSTSVTGTATLGGATVDAVFDNGTSVAKQYTILTAGSRSGSFASSVASTNLPSGFTTSLSYDSTHAFLDLTLSFAPPGTGFSGNQQNVANGLVNFFNTSGSIPALFGALAPAGLAQISGETATASLQTTFGAMTQFLDILLDPFIDGRGGALGGTRAPAFAAEGGDDNANAYARKRSKNERDASGIFTKAAAPFEARWSTWAAGFGGSQTTDGNAAVGSNIATSRIFGTAAGADYHFSASTVAGFAVAGGGTSFSVANNGTGRSDLFQLGAFVKHTEGAAYISGALAYGWQDITTDRTVTVAGLDRLHAEFNANAFSGRIEGGYRVVSPWIGGVGITPYAAGQFTTFDLPAYAESVLVGSSNFALSYNSQSATDSRSEVGFRTDKSYAMPTGVLTLRGRLAWAHDFNPDRNIAATFQTLPGASFVVNGAAQARDSALTTASAEIKWLNGWSAAVTFEGEFSDVTRSYAGKGVVRYAW